MDVCSISALGTFKRLYFSVISSFCCLSASISPNLPSSWFANEQREEGSNRNTDLSCSALLLFDLNLQ